MKQTLLLICGIFGLITGLRAGEIRFEKNKSWKQILALAKQKNKPIFFDAFASWCGPCQYMDKSVYTSDDVAVFYNASFINVKMDMEEGEGPELSEAFGVTSYPTFLFMSPDGKVLHRSVGAMKPADFIQLGKEAKNPSTQYYPLKEKARMNKLSDADFAYWASQARKLRDEDLQEIAARFIASKADVLANEHVATVALKYADSLTDQQMHYMVKNESRIVTVMKTDQREAARLVYDKLFRVALKAYYQRSDKAAFASVIRKFDPRRVNLASKDLEFRIAMIAEENSADAAKLLMQFLQGKDRLSLEEVAGLLIDDVDNFSASDYVYMAEKLEAYAPVSADQGKLGWLYLLRAICNYQSDEAKAKQFAEKALKEPGLPEQYRELLQELSGLK